jgi:nitrate reductase delta subunit
VTDLEQRSAALRALADLLSYPAGDAVETARRCRGLVVARAGRHLDAFVARAEAAGPQGLEELYSATFDLEPACAPYVGHHLFGDGPQRGPFLARLAGVYRDDGFTDRAAGGELPDHLAVVLRYLAATPRGDAREVLLRDGLVPAVDRMLAALENPENPYRAVLAAVREEVR